MSWPVCRKTPRHLRLVPQRLLAIHDQLGAVIVALAFFMRQDDPAGRSRKKDDRKQEEVGGAS